MPVLSISWRGRGQLVPEKATGEVQKGKPQSVRRDNVVNDAKDASKQLDGLFRAEKAESGVCLRSENY